MRAGILIHPIEIWAVTVIRNEFNEQQQTYAKSYETRANVIYSSGARQDTNHEVFYGRNITFEIRQYVPVGDFDYIKWNNEFYRILSIQSDDNNLRYRQMKRVVCELVNDGEQIEQTQENG